MTAETSRLTLRPKFNRAAVYVSSSAGRGETFWQNTAKRSQGRGNPVPITYSVRPDKRQFHIAYSGSIALHDVFMFMREFEQDFREHSDFDEFVSAANVNEVQFASREVPALFSLVEDVYRRRAQRKSIAFVAPVEPARQVVEAFTQYMNARLPLVQVRCFTKDQDAHAFLDA